jgi:GntR family transcriptional regulator/MocR family aminotransferase
MTRRSDTFELVLAVRERGQSAYRWLYSALRESILAGRLRPGMRLPATRDLAERYELSRGTVVRAFEELKSEGYLEGSTGSGTYVSRVLPEDLLHAQQAKDAQNSTSRKMQRRRLSGYARRLEMFPNFSIRPSRAFRPNLPRA